MTIASPKQLDGAVFSAVSSFYPELRVRAIEIRVAYLAYRKQVAVGISPIALSPLQAERMELAFASKGLNAKLSWIKDLHSKHSFDHCPVCGGQGARTIDHHLPLAHYPEFAVYSWNLVPCCSTCNSKRNAANKPNAVTTFNPYFDAEFLSTPIIFARIYPPFDAPNFKLGILPSFNLMSHGRVFNHVEKSVDRSAFVTCLRGAWTDLRLKYVTRHATAAALDEELKFLLSCDLTRNCANSWFSALVRGVLLVPGLTAWLVSNQLTVPTYSNAQLGI